MSALDNLLRACALVTVPAALLVPGCGGSTEAAPAGAPAPSCRDMAFREEQLPAIVCDEHARVTFEEGWIVCRCAP